MARAARAVTEVRTRSVAEAASAPKAFDPVTAAAALAGYRIATYVARDQWKDEIERLAPELRDYVRDYLRWAWRLVERKRPG